MVAVKCNGNNLNGFNNFLSLEHSLLLFDYNSSPMKITLYSFKQKLKDLLFSRNGSFV